MSVVIKGSSNVNFDFTTGGRITGDFSNATIANRVMFQNSVTNAASRVAILPNGTSTSASIDAFNNSDPTNASLMRLGATSTDARIENAVTGTGTYLPMTFYTGGSERVRVDTSGRVLVGTSAQIATSASNLQIAGAATAAGISLCRTDLPSAGNSFVGIDAYSFDSSTNVVGGTINFRAAENWSSTNHGTDIQFRTTASGSGGALFEAMRIASTGNVGIGTSSPTGRLNVSASDTGNVVGSGAATLNITNSNEAAFGRTTNLTFSSGTGVAANTIAAISGIYTSFSSSRAGALAFSTDNGSGSFTEKMRLDSAGNLGLGVTPSAWGISGNLEIGGSNIITSKGNGIYLAANSYFNSGFKYSSSTFASQYYQVNGEHKWFTAPSGTAGNAISFTQAMTLDSGGGLRLGLTTNIFNTASSERLSVRNTNVGSAATFHSTDTTGGYPVIYVSSTDATNFGQNAILFYRSGNLVGTISTTTSTTSYSSSSDYRLKHDITPMTGALAKVSALNPVTYKWNIDNYDGKGFIAHELAQVVPDAVTGVKDGIDSKGKPVYQSIDTSFLVATLTAAMQEQQTLIEALTARVAQLEVK